jgi:hypothetical protein
VHGMNNIKIGPLTCQQLPVHTPTHPFVQCVPGLSGLKCPGHGPHHPPPTSAEVANGLELYLFLLPFVPA